MLWILIGLGPIGLDGFSQLFSQMDWSWLATIFPYRESTPFLRVLTGALFGIRRPGLPILTWKNPFGGDVASSLSKSSLDHQTRSISSILQ